MKLFLYLKHFPLGQTQFHEGTSKAVHGLATGLARCGASVVILAEGPNSGEFQSPAGYQVICFDAPHTSPSFQLAPGLVHYVQNQVSSQDVVILNGIFHRSVYGLSKLLRSLGITYVSAPHDVYHPAMFQKNSVLKWPYWSMCEKSMLEHAAAIQLLDLRHADRLTALGVKTPCFALPNGLEPRDYPDPNITPPFHPEAPRAIFFGRMDAHHKGLDLLIAAFSSSPIAQTGSLTLQGPDAGDLSSLQALAQVLPDVNVNFLPPNYDQSPVQLLENYDIFCLTSRFEGFGLSALEAMVAGRVLLVSAESGIAPHVQASGCGVTIAPTLNGIRQGFATLLERRAQWPEMGLRGRYYALKYLQWEPIAESALVQYRNLIPGAMEAATVVPAVTESEAARLIRVG